MKDIRQIKLIKEALEKQKEKLVRELAKLNLNINKKINLIEKMIIYQKEYDNNESLKLSRVIPALNKNLYLFAKKITDVIKQAEIELAGLNKMKESIIESIQKLEKKIKLMDVFAEKIQREAQYKLEKVEQLALDDLTAVKQIRGEHE